MIDLAKEQLLSFREASKALPGRPSLATLYRWRLRGVRGIKLETCLVGGRRFTSMEALQRFVDQTTVRADGQSNPCLVIERVGARTPAQRERAIRQAEAELSAAGI